IRSAAAKQSPGIASTRPQPVVRRARHLAHFRNELVPLDVWIECVRRADSQRELATRSDWIDSDDLRRAGDPRALDGAQSKRSTPDDGGGRGGGGGGGGPRGGGGED